MSFPSSDIETDRSVSLHLPFFLLTGAFVIAMSAAAITLIQRQADSKVMGRELADLAAARKSEADRLAAACTLRESKLQQLVALRTLRESQLQPLVDHQMEGQAAIGKLTETIAQRQASVEKSAALQTLLQQLVLDLILLGKTDDDARTIVAKYKIQQNVPEASSNANNSR